ncbi:putative double-stranded RNA-binding protein 4 [Heracleum sosnowskyi]|uniref:Double-stranded RNA-binding protein 4 n=1 Tax=Heracleum sosnowskyi TaxID=360622 RepID=A0AAD8GMT2_9APIA|nr:putative double-stranded RNA-binding protein 4 [Heracleum sosnowskyi]
MPHLHKKLAQNAPQVIPADSQTQVTTAQPQLDAPTPAKPAVPLYKNILQQYTQREGLPLPVYQMSFHGELHCPQFQSTVVVNGESYASSKVFPTRKTAEMDAARMALLSLLHQEDDCSIDPEELNFCKSILKEYADKINAEIPDYKTETGDGLGFTSSLTFNGKQFVGDEGRNKKESQHLAARAVILSILDSDARGVISKIIKSKKKMLSPAKGKVNNPCYAQNVGKPAGIQTISNFNTSASKWNGPVAVNENIDKTVRQEPGSGNLSSVSAEPVSSVEASAMPNLEQLIVGWASSEKRKRKSKKAENRVGLDAQF